MVEGSYSSEGVNFCTKHKCAIEYPFTDIVNNCELNRKYNGCGNCPYSVHITIMRVEHDKVLEIRVEGCKKVLKSDF